MYMHINRIIGLLASVAMTACFAVESEPTGTAQCDPNATVLMVEAHEFSFKPNMLKAKKGQSVCVVLENDGVMAHNLNLQGLGLKTRTIQPGKTDAFSFSPAKPGEYLFFCAVPGHRNAGMKGNLTVLP